MTRIIVDPMELLTASATLQSSSIESAEIGAQLSACVRCPMPPAVRADVDQLVAHLDTLLGILAAQLHADAVELAQRAVIAALDPLAAVSAAPLTAMTTTNSGMGVTGGAGANDYPAAPDPSGFSVGGGPSNYPAVSVNPAIAMTGIGGYHWQPPAAAPFFGGLVGGRPAGSDDPITKAIQDSHDRQNTIREALAAAPSNGGYGTGPVSMPGSVSPLGMSESKPWILEPMDHEIRTAEERRTGRPVPFLTNEMRKYWGQKDL